MAQAKKTTTKKKNLVLKKTSAKAQPTQPPDPVVPVRREVGAVLSLFLALFVGISYFMNEGAFILFFSNLIKGIDRLGLLAHSTGVPARRNNSRLPPRPSRGAARFLRADDTDPRRVCYEPDDV